MPLDDEKSGDRPAAQPDDQPLKHFRPVLPKPPAPDQLDQAIEDAFRQWSLFEDADGGKHVPGKK